MRCIILFLSILLVGCGTDSNEKTLRVTTFNIKSAQLSSLESIANLARKSDIVLLQEVDRFADRSGNIDQIEKLRSLTGMHGYFSRVIQLDGEFEYGLGLLSKYPIVSKDYISLEVPYTGGWYEKRGAQSAKIDVSGNIVNVINTHLHTLDSYSTREARLLSSKLPSNNLILGGDFNALRGSKTERELGSLFANVADSLEVANDGMIDHIITDYTPLNYTIGKTSLSDHPPISTDIYIGR